MSGNASDLAAVRAFYAEEIAAVCNLRSPALVRALATVPRERFLGEGPWKIYALDAAGPGPGGYYQTVDADPRRVYHNVPIALDAARLLNNGQPATVASWIDALDVAPGERVVHIGCGTGYFTAILAEMVTPSGAVFATEADAELAAAAARNLQAWPNAIASHTDNLEVLRDADVILVNAGVTHPEPTWLDHLREGGRLFFPLTFDVGPTTIGKGAMVRVTRAADRFKASVGWMVAIYQSTSGRSPEMSAAVQKAISTGFMSGRLGAVRLLRRDEHEPHESCWLHAPGWCLSTRGEET